MQAPHATSDPDPIAPLSMKRQLAMQSAANTVTEHPVRSLRLSVTDRCNLRCRYCMPATKGKFPVPPPPLPLNDLAAMTQFLFRLLPLERIKITGGEPLLRRGLPDFIQALSEIVGVREVSMTTNGTLLERFAGPLKKRGLARVNISLDSLDPQRFSNVTRGGSVADVIRGIFAALEAGLNPVKLNVVLRRSSWQQDVPELLDFAANTGIEIRFIELMCTGTERDWSKSEYISAAIIEDWLNIQGAGIAPRNLARGPARMSSVNWQNKNVEVGWITPRSRPFCSSCDRLRMDSRGRIYRCLMDDRSIEMANTLGTAREEVVVQFILDFLAGKSAPVAMDRREPMVSIGG